MAEHAAECIRDGAGCLCLTCAKDRLDCCFGVRGCPLTECPAYKPEEVTPDADA